MGSFCFPYFFLNFSKSNIRIRQMLVHTHWAFASLPAEINRGVEMKYANIKYYDIANGLGVRTSLFVSGCTHRCRGCFNEEAWDFNYGEEFTEETIEKLLDSCRPGYIAGLTLLGGEPLEPANQRALLPLLRQFKAQYPEKNIWCYSGYTYERDILDPQGRAHCEATDELLSYIDILVDGEFDQDLYDISLKFRGSSNQRVLQLQKEGCPELFPVQN